MDYMIKILGDIVEGFYGQGQPYEYNVESILESVKLNIENPSHMHLKLLFFDPNSAYVSEVKTEIKKESAEDIVKGFTYDDNIIVETTPNLYVAMDAVGTTEFLTSVCERLADQFDDGNISSEDLSVIVMDQMLQNIHFRTYGCHGIETLYDQGLANLQGYIRESYQRAQIRDEGRKEKKAKGIIFPYPNCKTLRTLLGPAKKFNKFTKSK